MEKRLSLKNARWFGAVLGLFLGAVDTFTAVLAGVTFEMRGHDVTLFVWMYLGGSFAILGFFLGYVLEARRQAMESATLIRTQLDALRDAQARLAQGEKLATLGQLAAAIAHEVRNPLAIIRSSVQNLGEVLPPGDQEAKKSCMFVTEEIDRLTRVTGSILGFVRPLRVERRRIEVRDVLERAELLAPRSLGDKRITLTSRAEGEVPAIEIDPDLVCQALLGLLANAAEASPTGSEVRLEARAIDREVEIAVADSGPGVPPELRGRIFEPLFSTRKEGHGLGLAVVRQIIAAHGGRIEVGDRPGGGARFALVFAQPELSPGGTR